MSAHAREWQPGDKAFIEVEVYDCGTSAAAVTALDSQSSVLVVRTADLRPVPAGGEVEAATEEVIERVAESLAAEIHEAWEFQYDQCDHGTYRGGYLNGKPYAMCEITAERIVRRRAAAGLLAGGVPGRSEAEDGDRA